MGPPAVPQQRCCRRCDCRHPISGSWRRQTAFREVRVFEIREVLRLWQREEGIRSIERLAVSIPLDMF